LEEIVTTAPLEEERTNDVLLTHIKIQENHSYEILTLQPGFARVKLLTKLAERIDETRYLYEASIFSCANFCAVAAVNEKQNHIISAKVDFLNPIKVEDEEIIFEATATTNSSGKKQIDVIGTIKDIIVFESSFVSLKLDKKSLLKEESKLN
jgi:acyl-CoA thioesterase